MPNSFLHLIMIIPVPLTKPYVIYIIKMRSKNMRFKTRKLKSCHLVPFIRQCMKQTELAAFEFTQFSAHFVT